MWNKSSKDQERRGMWVIFLFRRDKKNSYCKKFRVYHSVSTSKGEVFGEA